MLRRRLNKINHIKKGHHEVFTPEHNETFYQQSIRQLKNSFSYPKNTDFNCRTLFIHALNRETTLFYIDGMVDYSEIEFHIIQPLQQYSGSYQFELDLSTTLAEKVLSVKHITKTGQYSTIVNSLLNGEAVLFVENMPVALLLKTTAFEIRSVEQPQTEKVIKGPMDGFTESASTNRSLIRKQLRYEDLITETITVGKKAISSVSLLYIKSIANNEIIENVRDRINQIDVDMVQGVAILEQHIEERPYSILPSILYTERPDRAAAFLNEGHVVLIMDNSPACLIVPITFWSFFHTAEDTYHRWAFGNFIRIVRLLSFYIALFIPSLYIAISNYHIEMFPTDLLLAIAATRERVPFPVIVEVIMMEISFELIREAGIRIPTPIGPTIGIVGALILGQAAVEAGIISPILVIIVAITGLASFAIPDINLNFTIRLTRFICLFFAATLGFVGLSIFIIFAIAYASKSNSFGVPFFAPMAPHSSSSKDIVVRPPVWKQWLRPFYVKPEQQQRHDTKAKGG